ncbi:MAG: ABC transporter ATP-binding protein [Blautia sp.]|nr:ABC transporter ATP-binding protein [Blautia sp.]
MLEVKNVSVEFVSGDNILAVDDMSLQLKDGSKTAIIGETGSGKSVLMLAMIRLLPSNARISGEILLDGENILDMDKKRLRQVRGGIISYVPQGGGNSMNPLLKVGFQIGEPLMEHRKASKKEAVAEGERLLRKFHVDEGGGKASDYPHTFSGGMRQRAMVAMGISAGARFVLADEPTKGLDTGRIALVEDTFKQLKKETLLCVTHDMNFAAGISEELCVMYAAQQLEYGRTQEVISNPLHPYTRDMLNAMPENGMKYVDVGFAPSHDSYLNRDMGCRYRDRCRDCTAACEKMPPVTDIKGHKVRCWKYVT